MGNERAVLPSLCRRLRKALDPPEICDEIILVDDGNRDGSEDDLHELATSGTVVELVPFEPQFWQGGCIDVTARLDQTSSDAVVIPDADLQLLRKRNR